MVRAWVAALAALAFAGCNEKTVQRAAIEPSAAGGGSVEAVVTGRVVDTGTREGIPGAVVGLQAGGTDVRTVATAGGVGNFPAGWFEVRGFFPSESGLHRLRVTHPSYATRELCVFVPATATAIGASPVHVVSVGEVAVGRVVDLPVLVRLDGTAEPGAQVFATDAAVTLAAVVVAAPDRSAFAAWKAETGATGVAGDADCRLPDIVATTGGDGRATLAGLDRTVAYTIVAPARDRDGDGRTDYASTIGSLGTAAGSLGQPLVIDLVATPTAGRIDVPVPLNAVGLRNPVIVDTGPIVATTTANRADASVSAASEGEQMAVLQAVSEGSVVLLFREPVEIVPAGVTGTGSPAFFWTDNLVDPTSTATINFPDFKRVDATIEPSSGGTVWRFTPRSALAENESITLDFVARSTTTSNVNRTFFGSFEFYRPKLTDGLSSATPPFADNFNGRALDSSAGAKGTVFLVFPEVVFGFYELLQFTEGTTTTRLAGFPVFQLDGTGGEGELVFTDGKVNTVGGAQDNPMGAATGTATGVFYRVPIISFDGNPLQLADHASGGGTSTVRVQLSAEDVEGNRVEGIFDLEVR